MALVGVMLAVAIPVSAASTFSIPLTVTETGGTARTNLALTATINNQALIDNGYILATGLDTATTTAHMVVDDRLMFVVPSLGANGTVVDNYTLGESPAASQLSIVPGNSGSIAVTDAAGLEPGSGTWSLTVDGYWDTAQTNKGVVTKSGALYLGTWDTGEIVGAVMPAATSNQDQVPDGISSAGGFTLTGGAGCTTENECIDTQDAKYIETTSGTYVTGDYTVTDFSALPDGAEIVDVQVIGVVGRTAGAGNINYQPTLVLGASTTVGTDNSVGFAPQTVTETLARPGGGSWTEADFDNLLMRVGLHGNAGNTAGADKITIRVRYYAPAASVTLTGVSVGEHSVVLLTDATNLSMAIDGGSATTTAKATVQDTANNWAICATAACPYLTEVDFEVPTSTQVMHFQPVTTIIGTALPDRSGNGNNGTFSFGSNPSGVSVSVGGITATSAAVSTAGGTESVFNPVTGTPQAPANLYATPSTSTNLPGFNIVAASGNAAIPGQQLVLLLGFGVTMILGFLVYAFTRHNVLTALVMGICLMFFGFASVIPAWVVLPYAFLALGIIFLIERPQT